MRVGLAPLASPRAPSMAKRIRAPGLEPPTKLTPDRRADNHRHRSIGHTWGEGVKDLRDWYRYLEGISTGSTPASPGRAPTPQPPLADEVGLLHRQAEASDLRRLRSGARVRPRSDVPRVRQGRFLLDLSGSAPPLRKPGRPPLTESREEIVRRVLDPALTLHEAAALLNVSKATLRRYTDQGKLPCTRTAGGQRRFKLSEVLALVEPRPPVEATK